MSDDPLLFHRYRPAAWLRAAGPDAADFLQGQFTNDLRGIREGEASYGLWLNEKGKVQADGFIVAGGGGIFWIGSYFSPAGPLRERLEGHIVADEVAIADETGNWEGFSLVGGGAGDWLARRAPLPGCVHRGRRASVESWEWMVPVSEAGEALRRLEGWREAGAAEMERLRIRAGIPAVPADCGPGDLPLEAGLDEGVISSTKGCYLGQEVVARLKSRGSARRRLVRIRGAGPIPPLPAELSRDGRRVGELRSAAAAGDSGAFEGLAMVAREAAVAGAALRLGSSEVEIV